MKSKYVQAAVEVLEAVDGGTLRSKELVAAMVAKGAVEDTKSGYMAVLNAVRKSDIFDTSQHGRVTLVGPGATANAANAGNEEAEVAEPATAVGAVN